MCHDSLSSTGGGVADKPLRADDGIFDTGEYKGYKLMNVKILFSKHVMLQQETSHPEKYIQWSRNSKHFCFENEECLTLSHSNPGRKKN